MLEGETTPRLVTGGPCQRLLTIDGVTYAHCGEDAQGHWIYRKD